MEHKQKFNKTEDYLEYLRAYVSVHNMQSILRGAVDVSDLQDQALIEMIAFVSVRSADALIKALQVDVAPIAESTVYQDKVPFDSSEQCVAWLHMADSLLSERKYEEAKKSFEKVLSLNPSKSQALKLRYLIDKCDTEIRLAAQDGFTNEFPPL